MYTKNLDKISGELKKTKKFRNIKKAERMYDFYCDNNCYPWAETTTELEYNHELYKMLLSYLPRDIRKRLKKIDNEIFKLKRELKSKTGWSLYDKNTIYSCPRSDKPYFKEPEVHRGPDGYYVEMRDYYFDSRYRRYDEIAYDFCEKNKELLNKLHELISMKEEILSKAIYMVEEKNAGVAREILFFLGYNPTEDEDHYTYYNRYFI